MCFKTSPKLPGGIEQTKSETLSSLLVSLIDTLQLAFLLQHCSCTSCSTKNIPQRCCRAKVSKKTTFCITVFRNFSPLHPTPHLSQGRAILTPGTDFHVQFSDGEEKRSMETLLLISVTLQLNNLFYLVSFVFTTRFLEARMRSISSYFPTCRATLLPKVLQSLL